MNFRLNPDHENHRIARYRDFASRYGIAGVSFEILVSMYDVDELNLFLPSAPTVAEADALRALLGVEAESGYLDYAKSTNTFELLMQWKEKMGRF